MVMGEVTAVLGGGKVCSVMCSKLAAEVSAIKTVGLTSSSIKYVADQRISIRQRGSWVA